MAAQTHGNSDSARSSSRGGKKAEYEDWILDPLPPQSRSTPYGRAMLTLASFAGRALSGAGYVLLILAGAANLGTTLLAFLLNRAAPGRGTFPLILVGISWLFWVFLALLRWRLNAAGPGKAVGETWGMKVEEDIDVTPPPASTQPFRQRAWSGDSPPDEDDEADSLFENDGSVAPGTRTDGAVSADAIERTNRAAQEFSLRRSTPFPRVEAAQRSIRALVGGPEQPAWVRFDLRPLMVAFVGVVISLPLMLVVSTFTMIALLVSTAPF